MPIFDYTEVTATGEKHADCTGLYIDEENYIQLLIARCFTGSVLISHLPRGVEFQIVDGFISDFYENTNSDPVKEVIGCVSQQLSPQNLLQFYNIPRNRLRNKKFFESLLIELSHFCLHHNFDHHTAAFVYIYRILEKISYPFPLLYASQTDDYKNSYGLLKEYFGENKGSKKGELGFFKSFIQKTYEGQGIGETSVDFNFAVIADFDVRKKIFQKLKQLCPDSMIHQATVENELLAVKFTEMSSFIITVRNRFFHQFNRGDANFEDDEIYDSEEFFLILNVKCAGWIGMVYFEILKKSYSSI